MIEEPTVTADDIKAMIVQVLDDLEDFYNENVERGLDIEWVEIDNAEQKLIDTLEQLGG